MNTTVNIKEQIHSIPHPPSLAKHVNHGGERENIQHHTLASYTKHLVALVELIGLHQRTQQEIAGLQTRENTSLGEHNEDVKSATRT